MTVSTEGLVLKTGSRLWRGSIELLSSMRFSISLLTLICITSVIGTVLKQNEPINNYINQFGPFWTEVFGVVSLYKVYSAWWFMLILGFLVISTSLCVARNTPKILVDLRTYKENIREQSLKAFPQRAQSDLDESPKAAAERIGKMLVGGGWKVKLQQRDGAGAGGWMVAAKAGGANKLGYIAAHSAIVLICLGGLADGDLFVRAQLWFNGKSIFTGGGMIADVKPEHRLSDRNPTFRGNLLVTEGTQSSTAILSQSDGVLIQELPFSVELKKFIVEYYSTGMPKLFASDIVIHDRETGEALPARVEVNHPVKHRGVEIFQSSFEDGGSRIKLKSIPLSAQAKPFEIEGVVGGSSELTNGSEKMTLEYTGLRVINVENFAGDGGGAVDVRKVDLRAQLDARLGAANKPGEKSGLRNVGPSVSYKLRDASGQAREYNNYMLPVDMGDGSSVFLMGLRNTPADAFRYLRVPADDQGSPNGFFRMKVALADPAVRQQLVQRYVARAVDASRPDLIKPLTVSTTRVLELFAGTQSGSDDQSKGGLQAVADFMDASVPEAERGKAGDVLIRILNGVLFELAQLTREQAGLKPLESNDQTLAFMSQAVLALSDVQHYPAPMVLQLEDFTHVQASVFQVARAPGKSVVYLGCALLILGVFAMLYIRERRVWVWLAPRENSGADASTATMAMSSNRKTMDGDREFEQLKLKLIGIKEE
jgi:cytochrome c biogenesis protein